MNSLFSVWPSEVLYYRLKTVMKSKNPPEGTNQLALALVRHICAIDGAMCDCRDHPMRDLPQAGRPCDRAAGRGAGIRGAEGWLE